MKLRNPFMISTDFRSLLLFAPDDDAAGGSDTSSDTDTSDTAANKATETGNDTALGGDKTDADADKADDGSQSKDDTALGKPDAKSDDAKDSKDGEGKDERDGDADPLDTVPEDGKYEFDLPEGTEMADADREAWGEVFKDANLTQRQVNAMVAQQAALIEADTKAFNDQIAEQQANHERAAKSDPDIGGDKWDETVKLANVGLDTIGSPELKKLILTAGHGNNPEILRGLRKIGQMVADDSFDSGENSEDATPTAERWYGKTTPNKKKA